MPGGVISGHKGDRPPRRFGDGERCVSKRRTDAEHLCDGARHRRVGPTSTRCPPLGQHHVRLKDPDRFSEVLPAVAEHGGGALPAGVGPDSRAQRCIQQRHAVEGVYWISARELDDGISLRVNPEQHLERQLSTDHVVRPRMRADPILRCFNLSGTRCDTDVLVTAVSSMLE